MALFMAGCTNCRQSVQQIENFNYALNSDVIDGYVLVITCHINYINVTDAENKILNRRYHE